MRHTAGCENVFSASWSEKEKAEPALLDPTDVSKKGETGYKGQLGKDNEVLLAYFLQQNPYESLSASQSVHLNNLLFHTLNYGCEVIALHLRRQTAPLPESTRKDEQKHYKWQWHKGGANERLWCTVNYTDEIALLKVLSHGQLIFCWSSPLKEKHQMNFWSNQ